MLEPVGLSAPEEALFRLLLDHPRAPAAELAAAAGVPLAEAMALLATLERRGLAVRESADSDRFVPALPDLALERLILRRQEELEQVRRVAHELAEQFRQRVAGRVPRLVDLVEGPAAVAEAVRSLVAGAARSVLVTERPPYVEPGRPDFDRVSIDFDRRGVACRRLHHRPELDQPHGVSELRTALGSGDDVRVLDEVPLKLLVIDGRRALVPLDPEARSYEAAVVVHARPLVDALRHLFDAMWARAVPIRPRFAHEAVGEERPGPQDQQLLTLLAAGLKDEAVARQLGLSSRTVVRRVDRMMKVLGADTRFQAGLQAVRRGWL